jgi:hypothetical protein
MLKKLGKTAALIAAMASLLSVPLGSVTASAVSASTRPAARYCFTEVAKIHPPQPATRVVFQTCSSKHARSSVLPAGVKRIQQTTLLVTFFQNEDYGGTWDTVGGKDGPCDTAGYSFSNLTLTNFNVNGISSYQLNNNCKVSSYWNETNFQGAKRSGYKGNNRWVGAQWNDQLLSMRTWA